MYGIPAHLISAIIRKKAINNSFIIYFLINNRNKPNYFATYILKNIKTAINMKSKNEIKKSREMKRIQFIAGFAMAYIAIKYGYPPLKQWLFF